MKENIFRFLYAILGIWLGIGGCLIYNSKGSFGVYLVFAVFGMCISLAIKEEYLNTTLKEILGLVIGTFLSFPLSYILQYLAAVIVLLVDIAKWLLGFSLIRTLALLLAIIIAITIIYYIVEAVNANNKRKK